MAMQKLLWLQAKRLQLLRLRAPRSAELAGRVSRAYAPQQFRIRSGNDNTVAELLE